jgi:hypothetical protein
MPGTLTHSPPSWPTPPLVTSSTSSSSTLPSNNPAEPEAPSPESLSVKSQDSLAVQLTNTAAMTDVVLPRELGNLCTHSPTASSVPSTSPPIFTLFPKLSPELKAMIWEAAAIPAGPLVMKCLPTFLPGGGLVWSTDAIPSGLLRACKASREVISKRSDVCLESTGLQRKICFNGSETTLLNAQPWANRDQIDRLQWSGPWDGCLAKALKNVQTLALHEDERLGGRAQSKLPKWNVLLTQLPNLRTLRFIRNGDGFLSNSGFWWAFKMGLTVPMERLLQSGFEVDFRGVAEYLTPLVAEAYLIQMIESEDDLTKWAQQFCLVFKNSSLPGSQPPKQLNWVSCFVVPAAGSD